METNIRSSIRPTNNRPQGRTNGHGTWKGWTDRCSCLTSRDIEAEALRRLAHRGYDWTEALRTRRRSHEWPCEESSPEPIRGVPDGGQAESGLAESRPIRETLVHA